MGRPSKLAVQVFIALICAALIVAPNATLAMSAPAGHSMSAMHGGHNAPCPSPCRDCGDQNLSVSCIAACMGLSAGIPPVADAFVHPPATFCATIMAPAAVRGQHREPDTPPPKTLLA